MKAFFEKVASSMILLLNPYLAAGYGVYMIAWSVMILIPKEKAITLATYAAFQSWAQIVMFVLALVIGIWLTISPLIYNQVYSMRLPLALAGFFWIFVSVFVFTGDHTSNTWLMYAFIAVYCLMYAANFSVNRDSEYYDRIINKSKHQ